MITDRGSALHLAVRITARGGRNAIDGPAGDVLRIRVSAAPVDGAANEAVIDVLSDAFGVPRSAIAIVRGHRSRNKIVSLRGLSQGELEARLSRLHP